MTSHSDMPGPTHLRLPAAIAIGVVLAVVYALVMPWIARQAIWEQDRAVADRRLEMRVGER